VKSRRCQRPSSKGLNPFSKRSSRTPRQAIVQKKDKLFRWGLFYTAADCDLSHIRYQILACTYIGDARPVRR